MKKDFKNKFKLKNYQQNLIDQCTYYRNKNALRYFRIKRKSPIILRIKIARKGSATEIFKIISGKVTKKNNLNIFQKFYRFGLVFVDFIKVIEYY